jgi:hypothetical protein
MTRNICERLRATSGSFFQQVRTNHQAADAIEELVEALTDARRWLVPPGPPSNPSHPIGACICKLDALIAKYIGEEA